MSARQGGALAAVLAGIGVVVALLLAAYLIDVLLLAFAAVLLALLLRAPADWLASRAGLPPAAALALAVLALLVLLGAAGWLFGRQLAGQLGTLFQRIPDIAAGLQHKFSQYTWLFGNLNVSDLFTGGSGFFGRGLRFLATTFGALASGVLLFFLALYLAFQPELYVRGFLRLLPVRTRPRAREVLRSLDRTLRWWLVGQALMMVCIATLTGIGLAVLGVPMAFALALLAGLLEFVPYAGPILSAVPAVLVALGQSPTLAGYVVLLYFGIQSIEGHVLQPIVQRKSVYLPPALVLLAQVAFGILIGPLGVMFATPLAASGMVLTRMLYVEGVLDER